MCPQGVGSSFLEQTPTHAGGRGMLPPSQRCSKQSQLPGRYFYLHYLFEHLPDYPRQSPVWGGGGEEWWWPWDTTDCLLTRFASCVHRWPRRASLCPGSGLSAPHSTRGGSTPTACSYRGSPEPKSRHQHLVEAGGTQSLSPWQLRAGESPPAMLPVSAHDPQHRFLSFSP